MAAVEKLEAVTMKVVVAEVDAAYAEFHDQVLSVRGRESNPRVPDTKKNGASGSYRGWGRRPGKAMRHLDLPAKEIASKTNAANTTGPSLHMKGRQRRTIRDRNAPKKNRTGYNYFFAQEIVRLKNAYPEMRGKRTISCQAIADAWGKLTNKQKQPFQQLGKERYQEEMRLYATN